jgi:transposase-like protein
VTRQRHRQHTREFKLLALARIDTAPDVQALARELGIERILLYRWQHHYVSDSAAALRNSGHPRPILMQPAGQGRRSDETRPQRHGRLPCQCLRWPRPIRRRRTGLPNLSVRSASQLELDFLRSLAACQGSAPVDRRGWRGGIYAVIHTQMPRQGEGLGMKRSCALGKVRRPSIITDLGCGSHR